MEQAPGIRHSRSRFERLAAKFASAKICGSGKITLEPSAKTVVPGWRGKHKKPSRRQAGERFLIDRRLAAGMFAWGCRASASFSAFLSRLLEGFYQPSGGAIALDGEDFREQVVQACTPAEIHGGGWQGHLVAEGIEFPAILVKTVAHKNVAAGEGK